ncbi:hypothetical protein EVAR_17904_1 [Eumeta japonica]|uniref:FLYWCH-type domain-containing protein n=1 Tax=Eumeta variegata TaxID=151549 RepID=A0A4C1UY67_EUMVA|nr:hypothetical protein EVAR_17904_1 [Eumeta japonica]
MEDDSVGQFCNHSTDKSKEERLAQQRFDKKSQYCRIKNDSQLVVVETVKKRAKCLERKVESIEDRTLLALYVSSEPNSQFFRGQNCEQVPSPETMLLSTEPPPEEHNAIKNSSRTSARVHYFQGEAPHRRGRVHFLLPLEAGHQGALGVFNARLQAVQTVLVRVAFITSKRGKPLIKVGDFTFCQQAVAGLKTRWRRGKYMLILKGYTYRCQWKKGQKKRWVCSTHGNGSCRAVVHTHDDNIVKVKDVHNHSIRIFTTFGPGAPAINDDQQPCLGQQFIWWDAIPRCDVRTFHDVTQRKRSSQLRRVHFYAALEQEHKEKVVLLDAPQQGLQSCSVHVKLTTSQRGNTLLSVGGYTFFIRSDNGFKKKWNCSTHVNKGLSFTKSRRGRTLLNIAGFSFCLQSEVGLKRRWVCSTHVNKKCKAAVRTYGHEIIDARIEHNHSQKLHS